MRLAEIRRCFSVRRNLAALWDPGPGRYASLDGIRAILVIWIVACHTFLAIAYLGSYELLLEFGDVGGLGALLVFNAEKAVDVFFALSGFLIGCILMREQKKSGRIRYWRFIIRRGLRIWPVYWAILGLGVLILVVARRNGNETAAEQLPWVWANFLYLNNFLDRPHMFMDWTWSLAIEEQFYIVFPLFLIPFVRARAQLWVLCALYLGSFLVRAIVVSQAGGFCDQPVLNLTIWEQPCQGHVYWNSLYTNLHTRYGGLVVGAIGAWLFIYERDRLEAFFAGKPHLSVPLVGSAVFVLCAMLFIPAISATPNFTGMTNMVYLVGYRNFYSLLVTILVLGLLFPVGPIKLLNDFLALRIWHPIAQLSYTVYLIHLVPTGLFMVNLVAGVDETGKVMPLTEPPAVGPCFLAAGLAFLVSMALALFWHLLVEKPFMEMRALVKLTR